MEKHFSIQLRNNFSKRAKGEEKNCIKYCNLIIQSGEKRKICVYSQVREWKMWINKRKLYIKGGEKFRKFKSIKNVSC